MKTLSNPEIKKVYGGWGTCNVICGFVTASPSSWTYLFGPTENQEECETKAKTCCQAPGVTGCTWTFTDIENKGNSKSGFFKCALQDAKNSTNLGSTLLPNTVPPLASSSS